MKARCSSLDRIALCSASAKMEEGRPSEYSEAAAEGTMCHEVLAGKKHELTDEQAEAIQFAENQFKTILDGVFPNSSPKIFNEQEFGIKLGNHELTGHVDRIAIHKGVAMLCDWKMGRNAVPHASNQIQVRGYGILVNECLFASRVVCAIIQPRLGKAGTTSTELTDWEKEREYIKGILDAADKPDAPFNPSEAACKYCRARGDCPAAKSLCTAMAKNPPAWVDLAPTEKAQVLETCDLLDTLIERYRAQAKSDLEKDPNALDGLWALNEGRETRVIEDASAAYGKLSAAMSPALFAGACKVSITKLETAYRQALNIKVKEAKEQLAEKLGELLTLKKSAQSLERVSK